MPKIGKVVLDKGWLAARSTEVNHTGIQLTSSHPPPGPIHPWMEAAVPGTVLGTLLKNKVIPDPFYGLQNEAIIDIADSGREYYTFWFFTKFECKLSTTQRLDLNFRAINYCADVYLNGHQKLLGKGMFRRHCLDITDILNPNGPNLLAVLVHPPDNPGRIPKTGGQGGDHEIGKDVAAQYVEGWDWIAPIRDRNTGIWDEVSIAVNGPVKIIDPHLVSTFFDHYNRAYLNITTELENRSGWLAKCTLSVQVELELDRHTCLIEHFHRESFSIPPGEHMEFAFPKLFFYKPKLWWPNGMGKQSLYNVIITLDVEGCGESDTWRHMFGFRKIESYIDDTTGGRMFKVNGHPVFIRGGNWILSDALLRLPRKRYEAEVKFHADMNFNMVRCWGGGLAERPEFYHYCDIYGLLVWQEFWITGDVDGRGQPVSNPNGPLDHDLFLLCAKDTIKLLRNHPSLALWVGGNEQAPPPDINVALKNMLRIHPHFNSVTRTSKSLELLHSESDDFSQYLDGTRVYVQGSLWDGFADGKGNFTDGPYEIQEPESFFMADFYSYGFNPEVGSVGMPVADTVRATMPGEGWQIPLFKKLPDGYFEEVAHPLWDYHKYSPYSNPGKVKDQILSYGIPLDLDDFCFKAQLANYVQYRALLEGWNSGMWSKYTGVLIWKSQNPWTGLRAQLYDQLLDQTGGFYGCRSAAEPVHVQLNLATYYVEVVNARSTELSQVAIEASVWDLQGTCPYFEVIKNLHFSPNKVIPVVEMKYPKTKNPSLVYFLLLKLYRMSDNSIISRNLYWLHLRGEDYQQLESYRTVNVPLEITSTISITGSVFEVEMRVQNKSQNPGPKQLNYENDFVVGNGSHGDDVDKLDKHEIGSLLRRMRDGVFGGSERRKVTELHGDDSGVAIFLHFSVRAAFNSRHSEGDDTRILPVHYSDNYFSLVPQEVMRIRISFRVPPGASPQIILRGWNLHRLGYALL